VGVACDLRCCAPAVSCECAPATRLAGLLLQRTRSPRSSAYASHFEAPAATAVAARRRRSWHGQRQLTPRAQEKRHRPVLRSQHAHHPVSLTEQQLPSAHSTFQSPLNAHGTFQLTPCPAHAPHTRTHTYHVHTHTCTTCSPDCCCTRLPAAASARCGPLLTVGAPQRQRPAVRRAVRCSVPCPVHAPLLCRPRPPRPALSWHPVLLACPCHTAPPPSTHTHTPQHARAQHARAQTR
jgi:hypothetical protein